MLSPLPANKRKPKLHVRDNAAEPNAHPPQTESADDSPAE